VNFYRGRIYKLLTRENKESSFFLTFLGITYLHGDKHSFICVVEETSVILLDIKIELQHTHLLRDILYEIDPGKANEPCYL